MTDATRFWSKVDKHGPIVRQALGRCWLWTGSLRDGRYGYVWFGGKRERAHRVAFFYKHGHLPSPQGLHRCDITFCVRPSHVYEGTQRQNVKDREERRRGNIKLAVETSAALRKAKRFCVNGHEYTSKNTYRRPGTNARGCNECRREAVRRYQGLVNA